MQVIEEAASVSIDEIRIGNAKDSCFSVDGGSPSESLGWYLTQVTGYSLGSSTVYMTFSECFMRYGL